MRFLFHLTNQSKARILFFLGIIVPVIIVAMSGPKEIKFIIPEPISDSNPDYEVSTEPGYVCMGLERTLIVADNTFLCPKGYAVVATDDSNGAHRYGPPQYVPVSPRCCRLPFDDILTERHEYYVTEKCPADSVATGGKISCAANCNMRCTYINSAKYALGPETQARYITHPDKNPGGGKGSAARVALFDVPISFRWGMIRVAHQKFEQDGCVGYPWGSLLVRKSEKQCSGYYYRQLFFKDGPAVPVVPNCDAVSDVFDPHAKCLVKKKALSYSILQKD